MKTNENVREFLHTKHACADSLKWLGSRNEAEMFADCKRGDWLLWYFFKRMGQPGYPTLRELTLAKARCAKLVIHLMTDERSRNAVEAAERFGLGLATEKELRAAYAAAYAARAAAYAAVAAAADAAAYAAVAAADAAAVAAADAAYAAADAAYAAADAAAYAAYAADADADRAAAYAAVAAADAAYAAAYAAADAAAAYAETLEKCADTCREVLFIPE